MDSRSGTPTRNRDPGDYGGLYRPPRLPHPHGPGWWGPSRVRGGKPRGQDGSGAVPGHNSPSHPPPVTSLGSGVPGRGPCVWGLRVLVKEGPNPFKMTPRPTVPGTPDIPRVPSSSPVSDPCPGEVDVSMVTVPGVPTCLCRVRDVFGDRRFFLLRGWYQDPVTETLRGAPGTFPDVPTLPTRSPSQRTRLGSPVTPVPCGVDSPTGLPGRGPRQTLRLRGSPRVPSTCRPTEVSL